MEQAWETHAEGFILKILKGEELLNMRLMTFFQGEKMAKYRDCMGHTGRTGFLCFELCLKKGGRENGNYVI